MYDQRNPVHTHSNREINDIIIIIVIVTISVIFGHGSSSSIEVYQQGEYIRSSVFLSVSSPNP